MTDIFVLNCLACNQCLICAYFSPDSDRTTCIMDYSFPVNNSLKLKTSWWICLLQTLSFLLWSHVDYLWIIVMFLSAAWTLILTAPIHCRWSISEQVIGYIYPNLFWWRNKLIYILDGLRVQRVHFQYIFITGLTVPLKNSAFTFCG